MKHLIIDFIKRWKWWLAGAAAVQLFYIVAVLLEAKTNFFLWILAVAATALVSHDLQKGTAKVHSLLPMPRRTIANSYWIQAVLLPTVVIPFGMLIETAVIGTFKPSALESVGSIPHITLLSFAFSGTLFFILTIMPVGPQPGLWRNLLAGIIGGSWGLVFAAGIFLSGDDTIHHWGTMALWQRCVLIAGVFLGIVSFFTSHLLVRYRATLRVGVRAARERTQARWIRFPDRTASLLEPWFLTLTVAGAVLISAGVVFLVFASAHRWNAGEAVRAMLKNPGSMADYGIVMLAALALIPAVRSLFSLRLIRTLPLSGWRLTGVIVSFPMLAWYAASLILLVFIIAAKDQHAFVRFARLFIFTTGLLLFAVALLIRYGPKFVFVGMVVLFPLMSVSGVFWMRLTPGTGNAVLLWTAAVLSGLLLSALGIWMTHRAITGRSQTYRPSNFMSPGGMGR